MRYTKIGYLHVLDLEDSGNILSVKIVSSDRGFPINVYGTIIVRDSIDRKCIYLFNRSKEDYRTINSEEESLILTGPGRGLVLLDFLYVEINLKVKVDEKTPGQQTSKGFVSIDGRMQPRDEKVNVGSESLKSWFSIVEVRYAAILNAVEATFEIEILKGHFCGEIKAGIEGVEEKIVIHNSTEDGVVTRGDRTVIKLRRRVMTICLDRMFTFEFVSEGCRLCGGAPKATSEWKVDFTPHRRGDDEAKVTCGAGNFLLKVVWSMMDILDRSPVA
ncbi:uncharacterized protein LOC100838884 [Brachypodium distachyon]|uniref:uncharacterized protein LOC100838884 n=1 Tax=Brachypodium distachyon TaxID=15368 RepID=UPI0001C71EF6|nr:uncharacterized protein LOC100838884 [Brachypodium distachyon]|eukprot:XP_003565603.1 uncharacterized protein LOC100838884 [Brachypodium distachyon]